MAVAGPPLPQFQTLTIAKRLRTDIPPNRMNLDVPETSPDAVWIMFLIMTVIAVLSVVGFLLSR